MPLTSPETSLSDGTRRAWLYIPLLAYVAGVVFLVLAGYQTFQQIELLIQQEKLNDLNGIAMMKIGQIDSWRESQRLRGEAISRATLLPSEFEQWVNEGAPAGARKQKIFQVMSSLRQIHGYRAVALFDRRGAVRFSSSDGTDWDHEDGALALQAMKDSRTILSDIHSENGEITIDLATPLMVVEGNRSRVAGAALLKINPGDFLFPLIQTWPTPSLTAETLLVRQEGKHLRFLNELRHHQAKALTLLMPVDTPALPSGMFLLGKLDPLNSVDYRGVAVVAAVSRVPGTPWVMVSKIDKEELFAPMVKLKQLSAALGLAFLAGCGILFFVWLRGIQGGYRHLKAQRDAAIHNGLLLKHFEYLTKYANDIILVANENGEIIEANERAVSTYGYTRDEFLGMQIWDLRPVTDDLSIFHEQIVRFRESGGLTFETVNRRKDGSIFPVEISARAIEMRGGKFLQGIIRDITERKAAENRIVRLNDLYAAISQTNSAIVRVRNQAELFQEICRIVVAHGRFRLAWIGLADADNRFIRPVAFDGPSAAYLDDLIIPLDAGKPENQGPTVTVLRRGTTVICNDFLADPLTLPWHGNARKHGLRASASWPLKLAGKTVGALNLYAGEVNYFDGEMMALLSSISQDVSFALDNLATAECLRQSEEKFRTLVDNLPQRIFVKDSNLIYISCNAVYARDKHILPGEITGKSDFDFYPQELAEKHRSYDRRVMAAGATEEMHEEYLVDGQTRIIQIVKAPFKNPQGLVTGVLGVFWDVTEQKRAEAMRSEIERAGRQDIAVEMASSMAHELSQPLAAANIYLTGCLHRMKDADWDQAKLRTAVDLAHKQTERAGSIINHLKNLIRKQGHERTMTDINALIRDTINFLDLEIKRHGIVVLMDLVPLPPVKVSKIEIEQVLINLFKNAIEAMQGVPEPLLRIATADLGDSGQIRVSVSDNGHGIPSTELATAFTPFHTSKTDGIGLGLAICRSLVENHGGRIWADEQRESGAVFNFTLPYEEPNE